jgi:hypothetical protein
VRTLAFLLLVCIVNGCGKKKAEPVPPTENVKIAPTATTAEPVVVAPADAAPPEETIEGEFVQVESFAFPEGKLLPIPKFERATKEAAKEHAAAMQPEFEAIVKEGYQEEGRFNVSFVPATYIHMMRPGSVRGGRMTEHRPREHVLFSVEGTSVHRSTIARIGGEADLEQGSSTPFTLMQTARGYFVDVRGDGTLLYVLARESVPFEESESASKSEIYECLGKSWDPSLHSVTDAPVPDYPGRGKDVDGDGKNEFPTARFVFPLDGWQWFVQPADRAGVCNLPANRAASIGVLGVTSLLGGWSERSVPIAAFYARRLKAAEQRAARIRGWSSKGSVARTAGTLRFSNVCALDVAQAAAELFVYARTVGESEERALARADDLMGGFRIELAHCDGIVPKSGGVQSEDLWPALRKALIEASIESVIDKDATEPTVTDAAP